MAQTKTVILNKLEWNGFGQGGFTADLTLRIGTDNFAYLNLNGTVSPDLAATIKRMIEEEFAAQIGAEPDTVGRTIPQHTNEYA